MIVLAVQSYNGKAVDPLEAHFDEGGGTIGRADGNLLRLPDPDRTVSRVHANIGWANGLYRVEDRGSNPVLHNGQALGQGQSRVLSPGDELDIGGYRIAVLADAPEAPAVAAAGAVGSAATIPDDWDPFAPSPAAASAAVPAPASVPSLEDLFGLPPAPQPLAAATAAAVATPEPAAAIDEPTLPSPSPLGVTTLLPSAALPSAADVDLDLGFGDAPAAPAPAAVAATPSAVPAELASTTPVVSWDSPRQATILVPTTSARRMAAVPPTQGQTRPGLQAREAAAAPAPAVATPPDELLQALMDGLGTGRLLPVTTLTPGLMRLIGSLLAEAVGGTLELLRTRATVKSELRADVTAIRPRQNNPLKFSPTPEVALQHLLSPSVPGFLPARPALRDAYRDLRAHEDAMLAAMRVAVAGLLQRFDPQSLETHMAKRSSLGSLLAGGRRAQLWEAYQAQFAQLSNEAEDDFHALFGRAFLKAYEARLAELQAADATASGAGSL